MAEASSSRAAAVDLENEDVHDKLEMRVWQACVGAEQPDDLWYQDDLMALDELKGKDPKTLLTCINKLISQCLFRAMEMNAQPCWRPVPLIVASNMRKMTDNERMIYVDLEQADSEGLWIKRISQRTGLSSVECQNALKKLESRRLVKQFQSSKYSNKKCYMLSHLHPSEDATGGLFYSEGAVDTELLRILMQYTEVYVHSKAWQMPEKVSENGKRKRADIPDGADPGVLFGSKRRKGVKPWPAGYLDYAKAGEVAKYLNQRRLCKEKIMEVEAQQVLELLCYDGRIEEVSEGGGYRTLLRPLVNPWENDVEKGRNGFSEVPCGGCPASRLCDESGPVNARTCEYFEEWLGLAKE